MREFIDGCPLMEHRLTARVGGKNSVRRFQPISRVNGTVFCCGTAK